MMTAILWKLFKTDEMWEAEKGRRATGTDYKLQKVNSKGFKNSVIYLTVTCGTGPKVLNNLFLAVF